MFGLLLTALHHISEEVEGQLHSSHHLTNSLCVFLNAVTNEYGGPNPQEHFGKRAILYTWTWNLYNLPLAKYSESPYKPRGQLFH